MADVFPRKSEIKDVDVVIKLKFDMKTHKSIAAKRTGGKSFGASVLYEAIISPETPQKACFVRFA